MVSDFVHLDISRLRRTNGHVSDNLVVQWGVQDNYEIVRKVGRGKYSEVSNPIGSNRKTSFTEGMG